MEIHVKANVANALTRIEEVNRQIPFIISVAINTTAIKAQERVRATMRSRFILRRASFIEKSVKIRPFSTKKTLTARIQMESARADFNPWSRFEAGAPKVGQGGNIAIPTPFVRPNERRVIAASKRPRALKNSFIINKGGEKEIAFRTGTGKRERIRVAYILRKTTRTPKLLHFHDDVTNAVQEHFGSSFQAAWNKTMNAG
jgi:hypothetical protein